MDVGANRGDMLELMLRYAPAGRHIAFEPVPALAAQLRTRFAQVEVREAALASAPGREAFTHDVEMPTWSRLGHTPTAPGRRTEVLEVATDRLDSALPDGYAPDLIKIDVEGAELQMLEGAAQTLATHRPTMVFEHSSGSAPHFGTTPMDVLDLLAEVGMRVFDLDAGGPYDRAAFENAFERDTYFNFVTHP
jgi:FkbM family methyltransferase